MFEHFVILLLGTVHGIDCRRPFRKVDRISFRYVKVLCMYFHHLLSNRLAAHAVPELTWRPSTLHRTAPSLWVHPLSRLQFGSVAQNQLRSRADATKAP